jgi:hypothetical protein
MTTKTTLEEHSEQRAEQHAEQRAEQHAEQLAQTIPTPRDVPELKHTLEKIIQHDIQYSNYRNNVEKKAIGLHIEKTLKKLQEYWVEGLVNIGSYSPFVLDRDTPSWQVDLWEPFLMADHTLSVDNFHNMVWLILKSRQIGFSYTMFRLQAALALSIPEMRCVLGAKDKTWITSIMGNIAPGVLPYRGLSLGDKNFLFKEMGVSNHALSFDSNALAYLLPDGSMVKLLGVDTISDKNRGLGNVSLIGIDEAAYVENSSIITTVLKPMLNFNQGSFIFGSTPNGSNWFKGYADECRLSSATTSRFMLNEYNLYTCGIYTEEECDRILWENFEDYILLNPTMTPYEAMLLVAQEYLLFFNDYGRVKKFYPLFAKRPDLYTYMSNLVPVANRQLYETYVSIDYGGTGDAMAVLFVAVDTSGRLFVFDEIWGREMGIRTIVDLIKRKIELWNIQPVAFYIDKSTTNRVVVLDKNTSIRIADLFQQEGLDVSPVHTMRKVNRVDIANEYFQLVPGSHHPTTQATPSSRVFIADSCTMLIKQLLFMEYEAGKDGRPLAKFNRIKNDDLSDAFLYVASELSGYKMINSNDPVSRFKVHTVLNPALAKSNSLLKNLNMDSKEPYQTKTTRYI